jgi:hypothetical protein
MSNTPTRRPLAASVLIFLHVFLGLNGLLGGGAFLLRPDGSLLQMPLDNLAKSPFPNFAIPGLLLFAFLGLYPLAVAYSLWKRPSWRWPDSLNPFRRVHWAWAGSLAAGVIAVAWILVQVLWIPFWFLQAFILGWGVLIILVTLLPGVRRYYTRAAAG